MIEMGEYEATLRRRAMQARKRLLGTPTRNDTPRQILARLPPPPPVLHVFTAPAPVRHILQDEPEPIIKPFGADIAREVAHKHGISFADITGPNRSRKVCAARHEAAFRLVVELGFTYPKAGRVLGRRDHTTIFHSVKVHAAKSPQSAKAWASYCDKRQRDLDVLRAEVIRLHFEGSWSVNRLRDEIKVSRITIMGWLLDEADRRRAA